MGRIMVGLVLVCTLSCGKDSHTAAPVTRGTTVAAVIKGLDNPFFATMKDGLVATARRHDARLSVDAAAGLQDTAGQASTLESLATQQAGCYVVNPISATNLISPLSHVAKGTPIVNIDSPVDQNAARAVGVNIATYIGTDNVAAGAMAADAMASFVGAGARVAVIAGIPGDATSEARTKGFTQGARQRFQVVQTVAADFNRQRGRLAAEGVLRVRPRVDGFFAVNDDMALGIGEAVSAAGLTGKVAVIGVDGVVAALEAVQSGAMSATIAQYPYTIGQLAVEACVAALRRKSLPTNVDAPVQVVTKKNVAQARAGFPKPVAPFNDPLARLLNH